jgi:PIN domain nuclease of toxin-antitoxin system
MSSPLLRIEPLYVVDTHALIWYLQGSHRLGPQAHAVFQAAELGQTRILVSAIVLAEMYYVNQKHGIFSDFPTTYRDIVRQPYFRLVPFVSDDVLDFSRDDDVPEMHDRMIAGLARRLNAPIITVDSAIAQSSGIVTIW